METSKRQNQKNNILFADELSLFFQQISLMLKAGILPIDAISLLEQDTPSKREEKLLNSMREEMEAGKPLSAALNSAECFPGHAVSMVQIGEDTGRLEQVLEALSCHYQREHELRQTLRQAVIYPAWLAVIIAAVTFVLVTQVLPVFQQVLQQLGSELTPWAASLMRFGVFSKQGAVILAIILLFLAAFLFVNSRTSKGQDRLRRLADIVLFRGALGLSVGRENFASTMALSLASGLNLNQAVEKTLLLMGDNKLKHNIEQCGAFLDQGNTFSKAAEMAGVFSGLEIGLLSAGFKAGEGETVMLELARRYHNKTEDILGGMMARLEPLLVILLVLVVGMLLLSVMLPLLAMMNSIGV